MWPFVSGFLNLAWYFYGSTITAPWVSTLLIFVMIFHWIILSILWIYQILPICSLGRHLGYFHFGAIRNNVAIEFMFFFCFWFFFFFLLFRATLHPSHICNLHHGSWKHQIPDPLVRLGIEPTSSCILVCSDSTAPQWELPHVQVFVWIPVFNPFKYM